MTSIVNLRNVRAALAFVLVAFAVSCGSTATNVPLTQPDIAVWMIDDDANLAFPACPKCGVVAVRGASRCDACGAAVRVEPKVISCPECYGSKTCVHCGDARTCVACEGAHTCAICDGTGAWRGETCPECSGSKACTECAADPRVHVCERCEASHVCSNCAGTGTITLE